MILEVQGAQIVVHLKVDFFDLIQVIGFAGIGNVVSDVRGFFGQFIGFDHEFLHQ